MALLNGQSALANCVDPVVSAPEARPAMQQRWGELMRMNNYPWGGKATYKEFAGDRITLGADYDKLAPVTKRQALEMLQLGGVPMGQTERQLFGESAATRPMLPFYVYGSDGRLISMPYDGCERLYFFTEFDRSKVRWFQRNLPTRILRYPLSARWQDEVGSIFWDLIGTRQADLLWIGWVPERGYFEITVANEARGRYKQRLNRFWDWAPRIYRFVVVAQDGAQLEDHGGYPYWPN